MIIYVDQYAKENEEDKKEIVLYEAIDCLQQEDDRRTQDIQEFIDDFITSNEYLDYVKAKKKIMKRTAATQCNEHDIIVEVQHKKLIEKYPLTEQRKKMYAFKEQFEKYAERQESLKIRRKQEKGIKAIREKIDSAKIYFDCTRETFHWKKDKRDERILQHYGSKLGTDLSIFSVKSRAKILEKIKAHHRVICTRREKKRQNIFNIIEKLLFDYGVKQQVKKFQNKTYDYKVKRKEKIIKDMEVIGTKIELIDRPKIEPEEPKIEEEPQPEVEDDKKKKEGKEKEKKDKKDNKEKQEKKPKDKKPAKDKLEKKKDKPEAKFELPSVPIVNPREKFFTEDIDHMLDLVEEFRNFDSELENKHMIKERETPYILGDAGLVSRPKSILFQNYDVGKTYYKTILITNVSTEIRKVRFLKFSFDNQYDEMVFDIEKFGIQKLYIGCHVKFWVNFQPYEGLKPYKGKFMFLSYDIKKCEYYQFEINIKCLPKYSNVQIYPKTVDFGCIPIWKAKNDQHSKVFKILNKGAKSCRIYIHKIADPLNIEAILVDNDNTEKDENKENIAPIKNSALNDDWELESYVLDILCSCIDNIDNNFFIEETFFTLDEFEETRIKVIFKNVDYIGNYFEKFTVDVYERLQDGEFDIVGCQEITLLAETTGHFLSVVPEILDFGICQINTCYQLSFELINSSKYTQAVSVRFPSSIADMIQADMSMVYLPPQGKRVMWFKLLPRVYIFQDFCIYFDRNTSILEFPIHIYTISKNYQDHPPVKLPVYAILSNTEDMTILMAHRCSVSNFLDTILVNMVSCSIYETIWTDIILQNNTFSTQFCGFIDLPQCVTLLPNNGFIKLYPNQRKKIKLYFSPEVRDFPSFPIGSLRNNKYFFKIKIDTISNIGQTKKAISGKKLKSTLDVMIKELEKNKTSTELSMFEFVTELKNGMEISNSMVNKGVASTVRIVDSSYAIKAIGDLRDPKSAEDNNHSFDGSLLNYQNFVILDTNSRKVIWCKVSLKRPLLEFSHQSIEFPDTPCGSYSVMEIRLSAVEKEMAVDCEVTNKKKRNKMEYTAYFRITGDSDEISIEPKCGTLSAGESVKITLLAKPNVPKEIVEQTAKSIKYSQIYEMKLKEYQASKVKKGTKEVKGKKEKGKDNKNEKSNNLDAKKDIKSKKNDTANKKDGKKSKEKEGDQESLVEEVPTFVITDKETEIDYLDLYPAEMVYWRNMEPYYIKAKFTCRIDYQRGLKTHKKPDWLYLNATCKVRRPDFITSLNLQKIDFGKCIIGMSTTKEIMLQNIQYEDIEVKTPLLNPVCCFSVPFIKDLMVPPEHSLRLPLVFSPVSTNKVTEFLEIRSNATVLPLILCGEGIMPNINITPNFTVFRLETKQNRLTELNLKIDNVSEAQANIHLEKIFEIEGRLGDYGKHKEDVKDDPKNSNKKEKEKKMVGKEKGPKFSDCLTDRELEAIDACFHKATGESHFDLSNTEKYMPIQPNSSQAITIFFGVPELLLKRKVDKEKKGKKETNKVGKSEESGSKKDGGNKKDGDGGKEYITQYNVFVGKTYITSIVLLCTKL